MSDDRISRYLADRAHAIDLAPGDPTAIARRASNRRHRRRAGVLGVTAVFAVAAVSVVAIDRGDDRDLQSAAADAVVESPFDWTVVEPRNSLAQARFIAQADDGTVYSLSTAPGASGEDPATFTAPPTLYRSVDGTGWDPVGLPEDLWASALAADGGSLYALGTSPGAGGSDDLVLARAGGDGWDTAVLDLGLDDLRSRFPGQVDLGVPSIAVGPDGPVAAVVARVRPDALVAGFVAEHYDTDAGWTYDAAGVQVLTYGCATDLAEVDGGAGTVTTTAPGAEAALERRGVVIEDVDVFECAEMGAEAVGSHGWDEVGLAPDLIDLVDGRLFVLAPEGDGELSASELPVDGPVHSPRLVAVDDGLRLVSGGAHSSPAHQVLRSVDGHTWEPDPAGAQAGYVLDAGALDGRLAVVVGWGTPGGELRIESGAGWSTIDLTAALPDGATGFLGEVAFGPLGLALVGFANGEEVPGPYVIHTDGVRVSAVALADLTDDWANPSPAGITVTADAILVRVLAPTDGTEGDAPRQARLVVGTPRA